MSDSGRTCPECASPFGHTAKCTKQNKPDTMSDRQWEYHQLRARLGEAEANRIIANRLREMANIIEAKGQYVYDYTYKENGLMTLLAVTISYPWGG